MAEESSQSSAPVLPPAPADSQWWDSKLFSGAVVIKHENSSYRMYYYGRSKDLWNLGVKPFNPTLPTGRIGLATSQDGLTFRRFKGPLDEGAIMDPSHEPSAFDCVHVGVSDVVQHDNKWWMFYFGGGMDTVPFLSSDAVGGKLQSGLAFSSDGITFHRRGNTPILAVGEPGEWDECGASWPRVVPPAVPGEGKWLMTYHTREMKGAGFFSAGVATSDDGLTWEKRGKVLSSGAPGAWDDGGVSVRHVVRVRDELVMFYEGCNRVFEFAIGLATSEDGLVWRKDEQCGPEPGGPVLKSRRGEKVWDNYAVAAPYGVVMEDGSLRLYYLGLGKTGDGEETVPGFGVAVSDGDYRTWTRV